MNPHQKVAKEYYKPERHNFYKQMFEREENAIYDQLHNPKRRGPSERIWNPSSARYTKRVRGKRSHGSRNTTSDLFPLRGSTRGNSGPKRGGRGPGGEPLKPPLPSGSAAKAGAQSQLTGAGGGRVLRSSRSGLVSARSMRSARSGMTSRSGMSSMTGLTSVTGSLTTGRSRASGSVLSTGRSVSTEIIVELRDRKVCVCVCVCVCACARA